jgi:hypothetical protein
MTFLKQQNHLRRAAPARPSTPVPSNAMVDGSGIGDVGELLPTPGLTSMGY